MSINSCPGLGENNFSVTCTVSSHLDTTCMVLSPVQLAVTWALSPVELALTWIVLCHLHGSVTNTALIAFRLENLERSYGFSPVVPSSALP